MIPDTETHVEPHKTGHRWLDTALALCAIFISVTSLAVAIHHGRTMERMAQANARLVAANSWPYLQFVRSNGLVPSNLAGLALPAQAEFSTSWSIVNAGVGPARIELSSCSGRAVGYTPYAISSRHAAVQGIHRTAVSSSPAVWTASSCARAKPCRCCWSGVLPKTKRSSSGSTGWTCRR